MLSSLNDLIEQRIRQARDAGDFESLPGSGQRLDLRDDPLVPEEVRVANRILKNAGLVPVEVDRLKSIAALRATLDEAGDDDMPLAERQRLRRRLLVLQMGLQARGIDLFGTAGASSYRRAVADRLRKHR